MTDMVEKAVPDVEPPHPSKLIPKKEKSAALMRSSMMMQFATFALQKKQQLRLLRNSA
jgi:hypothetical protein